MIFFWALIETILRQKSLTYPELGYYSIINTCKGMKKKALCPLSGVHLTIKPKSQPAI